LNAETAADLMHENPVSVEETVSIREAIRLLTEKGFSAAPVIDNAGRPIGVISQSDILVHDRERVEYLSNYPEFYHRNELHTARGEFLDEREFLVENVDRTVVADVMTPAVFSILPETPANKVVEQLLALRVHRLFVVDEDGVLVGVISTSDVLRKLQ
jgi:CBS domain-containing protein